MSILNKEAGSRLQGIDLLRAFAILCVVINHSTEQVYNFRGAGFPLLSLSTKIFAFTSFTLGRVGVPCFFTITGYLLMDRTYSPDQTKRFWKSHWLHLLICTWVWFSIYDLISAAGGTKLTLFQYLQHLLFLKFPDFSHVWYMPVIIGLYLLIPVLSNGLRQLEGKSLLWVLGLFSCYAFVLPAVNIILQAKGRDTLGNQFSLGFSGGANGLYLLMGSMVRKGVFRSVKAWIIGLLAFFCFGGTVLFQLWSYHNGYLYLVWYTFPLLYVLGICLLELASRLTYVPGFSLFAVLARYSFSVYLIHMIFLKWLIPWGKSLPLNMPLQVLLVCVLVYIASYLVGFCIARIPKIGPYILYVKAPQKEKRILHR